MARYVPEIVMNYDPDAAGQIAMKRSIELLLAKNLRVRILKLPQGLDPDDFVRQEGGEIYSRLLAKRALLLAVPADGSGKELSTWTIRP